MKKNFFNNASNLLMGALLLTVAITSCKSKTPDVVLPQIGGYNNSNEVAAANLKSHWTFDGSSKDDISGVSAAQTVGATYITGIKGQGVALTNGFLYYTGVTGLSSITSTTGFSVSAWFQVQNNATPTAGGFPSEVFQWVRANPSADVNNPFGNINFTLETGQFKHTVATGYDTLIIQPTFRDQTGGLQNNINNYPLNLVRDTSGKWIHSVIQYDNTTHLFRTWANGVKVSNFEDRGTNVFTPSTSTNAIIGAWISNVTGAGVNAQAFAVPFNGAIDEVRVFNKSLTDAEISALYQLERAGR
ncbi:MAG: LamG domain-containing protein [Bacteroidota bacterium]|nr:LamG domain-containing protein [Bacteroidota bacterium]